MRTLLFSLIAMLGAFQTMPDAFPREGAKRIIDNERVSVYDAVWPKGRPLPMHRHAVDMVGVELAESSVRLTSSGGVAQILNLTPGFVYFQEKGATHIEEEIGEKPRRAILIELKERAVPALPNRSGYPPAFPREGGKKLLENDRVVVWDYSWTIGKPTPMHFHDRDVVVVYMEKGEMQSTTPAGVVTPNSVSPGDVRFNVRDRTHFEELLSGKARAIIFELK